MRVKKKGSWGFSVVVRKKGSRFFYRSEVMNLGVQVEQADVRWVGVRRKKSTQIFWGAVCWVWVAPLIQ